MFMVHPVRSDPQSLQNGLRLASAAGALAVSRKGSAAPQCFSSSKSEMDIWLFPPELVSVKTWAPNHTSFSKTVGYHPFPTAFFHVSNQNSSDFRYGSGAEPSLPHRKDCEALLGGSSVEQVLAAQTVQSLQGSCEKSWAFASRLNSMKERQGDR